MVNGKPYMAYMDPMGTYTKLRGKSPSFMGKSTTGWWARATPLKNEFVSWDDDIPNICKNKTWQPNHQLDYQWAIFKFANCEFVYR